MAYQILVKKKTPLECGGTKDLHFLYAANQSAITAIISMLTTSLITVSKTS